MKKHSNQNDDNSIQVGYKDVLTGSFDIDSVEQSDLNKLDEKTKQAVASDNHYKEITEKIVQITERKLDEQHKDKNKIREPILYFIIVLLSAQFVFLAFVIAFPCAFEVSEKVLTAYTASVFAETFAGLTLIIKFAFDSKQETKLVTVLNSVIENYQKFQSNK